MDGAVGDEVVVVLVGGQLVHVLLGVERAFAPLGGPQVLDHLVAVDALLQP